ncbi:hypothetical protein RJ639_031316 [Escallonia herrerae]|uniref:ATPase AAA-type core domain-containing protein n=1 Tax=Escallonia herrerae TaxID=1293975 RepID=A0AA89BDH6_9ASTE|nr:hypothetical protein RJ639_031316 [Escallonia herrerae]
MAQNGSISRKRPNILVTGTPGTGKTMTALAVAEATELRHVNVSDLVKERSLHDGIVEMVSLMSDVINTTYHMLEVKGYSGSKLSNNLDCEIFQMLLEEARESYSQDILMALKSDTIDDMNKNVAILTDWSKSWIPVPAP